MYQCSKCGKPVEDGQACSCMFENTNQPGTGAPNMAQQQPPIQNTESTLNTQPVQNTPLSSPEPIQQTQPAFEQPFQNNINNFQTNPNSNFSAYSAGFFASAKSFFLHPATAVKEAVRNQSFKVGLVCMVIYILILGVLGIINSIDSEFKYYNNSIESAEDNLKEAKKDLKDHEDSGYMKDYYKDNVTDAKKALDKAESKKADLLKDEDFYKGVIKSAWNRMVDPLITLAVLIVVLFVMGKVFNGTGSFKGLIAGVGLATLIFLISALVLPLIAIIPHLGFFNYIIPAFSYIFALLVYVAFTEAFNFDTDKSVWAVLIAFAIAMLISNLIVAQIYKPAVDDSLVELEAALMDLYDD